MNARLITFLQQNNLGRPPTAPDKELTIMDYHEGFLEDVISGLSQPLKKLSSMYFYDEKGDKIFQEIMRLEEYYLPEAELEILKAQAAELVEGFDHDFFDVVELGAGDGSKTVYFLERLKVLGKNFIYCPLDISPDVLETNASLMKSRLPDLKVKPVPGDYFKTLSTIDRGIPKIILFMGSNIGNYSNGAAVDFLKKIKSAMQVGDRLLVGIDLKKNPKTILRAYNDCKGVTRRFNMNLLERINRELGANFDLANFDHYPTYDPLTGTAYSFLVSMKKQIVRIGSHSFDFKDGEVIHTEVSQKYDLEQIEKMGQQSGFGSVRHFMDGRGYFSVSAFE